MRKIVGNIIAATVVVTAVVLSGHVVSGKLLPARSTEGTGQVQARLQSRQSQWRADTPLELEFAVVNVGKKTVRFDGRMSWPGNILLMVKTPSGKVLRATNMCVRMTILSKSDIVILQPNRLYGIRLLLKQGDHYLTDELRKPRRGRYLLWAEYCGVGNAKLNCREMSITSNKVAVEVR